MDEKSDINETVEQHEIAVADGLTEGTKDENEAASRSATYDVAKEVGVAQPVTSGETISLTSEFEHVDKFYLDLKLESEQTALNTKASPTPSDDSEPSFVILNEENESLTAVGIPGEHKPADKTPVAVDKVDDSVPVIQLEVGSVVSHRGDAVEPDDGAGGDGLTKGKSTGPAESEASAAGESAAVNTDIVETVTPGQAIGLLSDVEAVDKQASKLKLEEASSILLTESIAGQIATEQSYIFVNENDKSLTPVAMQVEKQPTEVQRRTSVHEALSSDDQIAIKNPELDDGATNKKKKEEECHSLPQSEAGPMSSNPGDLVQSDDLAVGDGLTKKKKVPTATLR